MAKGWPGTLHWSDKLVILARYPKGRSIALER